MDDIWDDLGYKPVSKEEKEKAKKEYRRLMEQFQAKDPKKRKPERNKVIMEGRF